MKTNLFQIILPLIACVLSAAPARGQSWTNLYRRPGSGVFHGTAVAVDRLGRVDVAGYSLDSNDGDGYVTIQFSPTGTPLWTNRAVNGPFELGNLTAIAVDGNSRVYVTGSSRAHPLSTNVTIAYSGDGTPLWTNRVNLPGQSAQAAVIAADDNGKVYVAFSTSGSNVNAYATIAYASNGTPLWTNLFCGSQAFSSVRATGIAVDHNDTIYVTGVSTISESSDYATVAYSSGGAALWTNHYAWAFLFGAEPHSAIAVDSDGNACITAPVTLQGYDSAYVTIKYSHGGVPIWTNIYSTGGGSTFFPEVATDRKGSVIVTGYDAAHREALGGGIYAVFTGYTTVKYLTDGAPLWTNRFQHVPTQSDYATAIAVDSGDTVYITGVSYTDNVNSGFATIAYSEDGAPLWTNLYFAANGNVGPPSIAVDLQGGVYVMGHGIGSDGYSDLVTLRYAPPLSIVAGGSTFGVANGEFRFNVYGSAGSNAIIQASAELMRWTSICTNRLTNGIGCIRVSTNVSPSQFYRALLSP